MPATITGLGAPARIGNTVAQQIHVTMRARKFATLQAERDALKAEVEYLRGELHNAHATVLALKVEVEYLHGELHKVDAKLELSTDERNALQQEVGRLEAERKRLAGVALRFAAVIPAPSMMIAVDPAAPGADQSVVAEQCAFPRDYQVAFPRDYQAPLGERNHQVVVRHPQPPCGGAVGSAVVGKLDRWGEDKSTMDVLKHAVDQFQRQVLEPTQRMLYGAMHDISQQQARGLPAPAAFDPTHDYGEDVHVRHRIGDQVQTTYHGAPVLWTKVYSTSHDRVRWQAAHPTRPNEFLFCDAEEPYTV
jgi:hypothetical protein